MEERGFKRKYAEEQIGRAKRTSRDAALTEYWKKENARVPLFVTYHPGLPNIGDLLRDLHPILKSSYWCKEAIPETPMMAFRKPKSLAQ